MNTRISLLLAAVALSACSDAPTAALDDVRSTSTQAVGRNAVIARETLIGLTENSELSTFESGKSNQTTSLVPITGLAADETVVGIDFRPSDLGADGVNDIGTLYALTSASRLYKVDPVSGAATMPVPLRMIGTLQPIVLDGTSFGIGFNPAVDRLRVHSNTNQNLRINVESGITIVDASLEYSATDVNAGKNADVTASGYTNNDADPATTTELYAIDVAQNVLVEFGAGGPNGGKLVTVGALGVQASLMAGFDISNVTGIAYAVLGTSASGKSELYTIDLDTGAANKLGLLAQTKGTLLSVVVRP